MPIVDHSDEWLSSAQVRALWTRVQGVDRSTQSIRRMISAGGFEGVEVIEWQSRILMSKRGLLLFLLAQTARSMAELRAEIERFGLADDPEFKMVTCPNKQ